MEAGVCEFCDLLKHVLGARKITGGPGPLVGCALAEFCGAEPGVARVMGELHGKETQCTG